MSKALVSKATTDDNKPVSGFVLKELSDLTKSSPKECSSIEGYLLDRLTSSKPDVRFKALKCIKFLCENGRPEFKISLQRNNDAIRQCLHFRGPPDALRGDAPYTNVHEAAKEAMNAVFNNSAVRASTVTGSGRIEGYGSAPTAAPASTAESDWQGTYHLPTKSNPEPSTFNIYGSGRMMAIGSSPPPKPTLLDRMSETLTQAKSTVSAKLGISKDDAAPSPSWRHHQTPDPYSGVSPSATSAAYNGELRQRGHVGGSWGSEHAPSAASTASPSSPAYNLVVSPPNAAEQTRTRPVRDRTVTDGVYEGRLVDEITAASGMRPTPRQSELNDFVKKAEALDHYMLASLLDKKLAQGNMPNTQMKALCVIEAMLKNDNEDFEDYFYENHAAVEALEHASTPAMVNKAKEVLYMVGLREKVEKKTQPAVQAPANLLPVWDASNEAPTSTSTVSSSGSAFDFLDSSAETKVDNTGDMFGSLNIKDSATPAAASANSGLSLLDSLSGSPAPAALSTSTATSGSLDLFSSVFGGASASSAPATTTSNTSLDLFDSLSVSSNPAPTPASAPKPATSTSDPFAFMNNSSSNANANLNTNNRDPLAYLYAQQPQQQQQRIIPHMNMNNGMGMSNMSAGMNSMGMGMGMNQGMNMGMNQGQGMSMGMQNMGMMNPGMAMQNMNMGMPMNPNMGMGMQHQQHYQPQQGYPYNSARASTGPLDFQVTAASHPTPSSFPSSGSFSSHGSVLDVSSAASGSGFDFVNETSKNSDSFGFVSDLLKR